MPRPAKAGRFDIADIVRAHRSALEASVRLTTAQKRVLTDIAQCRTAALGGHVDRCLTCGYEHPSYNSCRNRHCPKCPALAQEKWIEERRAAQLDVRHFHVVFTLPAELRPLARFAPSIVYNALFQASQRTLLEFGQSRLGGTLGATLVLHTWTRALHFHPHIHAIVTGGALSTDGARWHDADRRYLFPVRAMGNVFRAKMLALLRRADRRHAFTGFAGFDDPDGFDRLMRRAARQTWNVYSKAPFKMGRHVLDYLGRYTHRVGIANSRLVKVTHDIVRFRTRNGAVEALAPVEFLRRLVLHVLPPSFHKIRHIGLYASAPRRRTAAALLGQPLPPPAPPIPYFQRLERLTGRDVTRCPRCGLPLVAFPLPRARDPTPRLTA